MLGRVLAGLFSGSSYSHRGLTEHLLCAGFLLGPGDSELRQAGVPRVFTELILVTRSHVSQ